MNLERTKKLTYKPFLYGFTAGNLLLMVGLGIANIAWIAIVKVPNPVLVDAFFISLGTSSVSGVATGVDIALDHECLQSEEKS